MKYLLLLIAFPFSKIITHAEPQAYGEVSIWAHESIRDGSQDHVLELKVYVEGKYQGMIRQGFTDMTVCGLPGAVTFKLTSGTYQIEVRGIHRDLQDHNRQQTIQWGGTFSVEADICNMIKVGKDQAPELLENPCETTGELGIYLMQSMREKVSDTRIILDGNYFGNLNTYHRSERSCGDHGVLTREVNCGEHKVEIIGIRLAPKKGESREYRAIASFILDSRCMMLPIDY